MSIKKRFNLIKNTVGKLIAKPLIFTLLLLSISVDAEEKISKHQQIMAGFLLHLTSFTQWQNLESDSIKLCLFGSDAFKKYIKEMIKRRPRNNKGKLISLSYIANNETADLSNCQIIYLQPKYYRKLWESISPMQSVLLVSQSEYFLEQGGMINFVQEGKQVKLEVNLPAVKAAQLKISSELLKHAKIITGKPHKMYTQGDDNHVPK